ncbi:MAG: DoxX family protein [Alphaproteobacteria bacterium]|nr:DoxX family protein [Alphaproteobacteria bacterium]
MNLLSTATHLYTQRVLPALDSVSSVPVFAIRLWIADIFFKSGLTKLRDWDSTIALFGDEYKVPVLPPELAATLGTGTELIAPILLVLGLGSRLSAAAMLFMTGIIEFTYMHFDVHVIWTLMLTLILFQGPGKLSVDYFLRKKFGSFKMKDKQSFTANA